MDYNISFLCENSYGLDNKLNLERPDTLHIINIH